MKNLLYCWYGWTLIAPGSFHKSWIMRVQYCLKVYRLISRGVHWTGLWPALQYNHRTAHHYQNLLQHAEWIPGNLHLILKILVCPVLKPSLPTGRWWAQFFPLFGCFHRYSIRFPIVCTRWFWPYQTQFHRLLSAIAPSKCSSQRYFKPTEYHSISWGYWEQGDAWSGDIAGMSVCTRQLFYLACRQGALPVLHVYIPEWTWSRITA